MNSKEQESLNIFNTVQGLVKENATLKQHNHELREVIESIAGTAQFAPGVALDMAMKCQKVLKSLNTQPTTAKE